MTQWNEQLGWHRGDNRRALPSSTVSLRGLASRVTKDVIGVPAPSGPPG